MQSPGPHYQGVGLYPDRNYESPIINSHGLPGNNNYLAYQTANYTHTNYTSNHQPGHYNSQAYEAPINHYNNEGYANDRGLYNASLPMRQAPVNSNIKQYWNDMSMPQNNSHYNNLPPPPPLASRSQPATSSPTIRSPNLINSQCNNGNSYPVMSGQHASPSPQSWSQSPGLMNSPRATPSPLAQTHARSPGHVPPHFSPPHSRLTESPQASHKANVGSGYPNQGSGTIASQTNSTNPLQSLQKMVLVESDNADVRGAYDNLPVSGANMTGPTSVTAQQMTNNTLQRSYYNSNDQLTNADPDSPYPTYYNLDQNRLCTPPRPSPVSSYQNIPQDSNQLTNYCMDNVNAQNNNTIHSKSGLVDKVCDDRQLQCLNTDKIVEINNKKQELVAGIKNDTGTDKSDLIPANDNKPTKHDELTSNEYSTSSNEEASKSIEAHESRAAVINRRTSKDSLHSSDSETNAYNKLEAHQTSWQMNSNEKEYYQNSSENKHGLWWPQSTPNQLPQPPILSPTVNNLAPSYPVADCRPPTLTPVSTSTYQQSRTVNNNFVQSEPSETVVNTNASVNFENPEEPKVCVKKKRGRPFGSKNRVKRRPSEEPAIEKPSSSSKKKKSQHSSHSVDAETNTWVSINPQCSEQPTSERLQAKRKKMVGPFIRIEKKESHNTVAFSIVNVLNKPDDDKDFKGRFNIPKQEAYRHLRRPSLLGNSKKKIISTISSNYDPSSRDSTWVCALCHQGPHFKSLGDLYGPYNMNVDEKAQHTNLSTSSNSIDETINSVVANEKERRVRHSLDRRRRSDNSDDGTTKRSKSHSPKNTNCISSSSETTSSTTATEVWIHEDCIIWSNGVYLVGQRVRNLEEIIKDSSENQCTKCKLSGATLGCLQKSCTSQYHFLCARERGCEMDEENFSLHCPKHKKKTKESTKANVSESTSTLTSPKI